MVRDASIAVKRHERGAARGYCLCAVRDSDPAPTSPASLDVQIGEAEPRPDHESHLPGTDERIEEEVHVDDRRPQQCRGEDHVQGRHDEIDRVFPWQACLQLEHRQESAGPVMLPDGPLTVEAPAKPPPKDVPARTVGASAPRRLGIDVIGRRHLGAAWRELRRGGRPRRARVVRQSAWLACPGLRPRSPRHDSPYRLDSLSDLAALRQWASPTSRLEPPVATSIPLDVFVPRLPVPG